MGTPTFVLISLVLLWERVGCAYANRLCKETEYLNATMEPQFIQTPNYPVQYTNNEQCRWLIRVVAKTEWVVKLKVVDSKLQQSATCGEDYGDIKDGAYTWSRTMRKWCGDTLYEKPITSSGPAVLLTFRSNKEKTERGFKIEYWSAPKTIIKYDAVVFGPVNYVLFAFFGFIVFSLLLGLFIISCLHKRRAHIRLKTENSTEEKMTFSHTKIYETTPSRGSSARTRLCSVTPTGETPGLTPV